MNLLINGIKILFIIASIGINNSDAKCQPGYPMGGFVLFFNADFIQFPDSLNTDNLRARYLDTTLSIIFVDSSKSILKDSNLINRCSKRVYSVDSSGKAKMLFHITPQYEFGELCYNSLHITADTLENESKSQDLYFWYTGKLIFIYNGIVKEFLFENIPDGSRFDLDNIRWDIPKERILLPAKNNQVQYNVNDLLKYRN